MNRTPTSELIKEDVELPMACHCGEENKKEMAKLLEDFENLWPPNTPFLTKAVVYLDDCHGASISGTASDMWSVIVVSIGERKIRCECDMLEHGLARICLYLHGINPDVEV